VSFPGGIVQRKLNEDPLSAAIRETYEETQIDLTSDNYAYLGEMPDNVFVCYIGPKTKLMVRVYAFTQMTLNTPPIKLQHQEIADFRWCHFLTLYNLPHPKYFGYCLQQKNFKCAQGINLEMPVVFLQDAEKMNLEDLTNPAARRAVDTAFSLGGITALILCDFYRIMKHKDQDVLQQILQILWEFKVSNTHRWISKIFTFYYFFKTRNPRGYMLTFVEAQKENIIAFSFIMGMSYLAAKQVRKRLNSSDTQLKCKL